MDQPLLHTLRCAYWTHSSTQSLAELQMYFRNCHFQLNKQAFFYDEDEPGNFFTIFQILNFCFHYLSYIIICHLCFRLRSKDNGSQTSCRICFVRPHFTNWCLLIKSSCLQQQIDLKLNYLNSMCCPFRNSSAHCNVKIRCVAIYVRLMSFLRKSNIYLSMNYFYIWKIIEHSFIVFSLSFVRNCHRSVWKWIVLHICVICQLISKGLWNTFWSSFFVNLALLHSVTKINFKNNSHFVIFRDKALQIESSDTIVCLSAT